MIDIKHLSQGRLLDIELLSQKTEPESLEPHRHEYFEIFWTLQGTGNHKIDFIDYALSPNLIYCIPPGLVHECTELPETLYAISFNADLISSEFRSQQTIDQLFHLNQPFLAPLEINESGRQELSALIALISNELQQPAADTELLSILLTGFLRYLLRYQASAQEPSQFSDLRVSKLLSLIEQHYTRHKDTSFYAHRLALTNKRLNELTRENLSKTVTQLLHDRIILEARRNLAFTNKTVKALALDLGYKDTAYFCRFFRRLTGESPSTFRKQW